MSDVLDGFDEWLTRPLPRVTADPDPPTERFAPVVAEERPAAAARPSGAARPAAGAPSPGPGSRPCLSLLVVGGATAVAADKVVTVSVDGREQVVHTFAADVGGALASAGIVATAQDRVEPAPPPTWRTATT